MIGMNTKTGWHKKQAAKHWLWVAACVFFSVTLLPVDQAGAVRIKDLASVQGVRGNQLVGFGLVVGLDGTGDGNKASFTTQGLINMLENMGVHVNPADIKVKNVAGVMLTAKLPPFVKAGQTIDVTLSSLGDASSLQGGTLVITPLKGLDGKVYAMAQGSVSVGGFEVEGAAAAGVQKNHLTVGRIPSGATVERELGLNFSERQSITWSLNHPDFTTISRMVQAIDQALGGPYATALDGATVEVIVPESYQKKEISLLARIESLEVVPDSVARVVLDERTGTVVMGEQVRLKQLALSHGRLSLRIGPGPGAAGDRRLVTLEQGASLGDLVRALNSVGVTPRDMIAIFQSIKASGALMAELVII
jgi:flagellar P-ring protein precursor FlgI